MASNVGEFDKTVVNTIMVLTSLEVATGKCTRGEGGSMIQLTMEVVQEQVCVAQGVQFEVGLIAACVSQAVEFTDS